MFDWGWRILFLLVWGTAFSLNGPIYSETGFNLFLINSFGIFAAGIISAVIMTIAIVPIIFKLFKIKSINKPKTNQKLEPINNDNSLTKDIENTSEERLEEEKLYEFVINELKSGERREGLWTKAMVQASGDEKQIEKDYIKLRVQSLIDEKERTDKEVREIEEKKKLQERLDRKNTSFRKVIRFFGWILLIFILYIFWGIYFVME